MTSPADDYLLFVWVMIACLRTGWPITMLSESQLTVVNVGDTITLECRFTADKYNMFDYPLLWRKIQRGEESQVNIMGNVNQPFLASGRYEVSFTPGTPDFRLTLQISGVLREDTNELFTGVLQEDSGNYTCEVRGPQSVILGHVTHFVLVRSAIDKVIFTDEMGDVVTAKSVIQITGGAPSVLRCVVSGGFPPPNVAVFVGHRDATNDFRFSSRANVTGSRGVRLMTYHSERRSDRFVARREDSGLRVQCIGTVPGLKPSTTSAVLDVLYGPTISCSPESGHMGETNINLKCEIRSNPRVFALFWVMDDNGTTLAEGEVIDEAWTLVMDRPDRVVEAQLYLHRLEPSSFRTYTLVAENTISTAAADVRLTQMPGENRGGVAPQHLKQQPQETSQPLSSRSSTSPELGPNNNISVRSVTSNSGSGAQPLPAGRTSSSSSSSADRNVQSPRPVRPGGTIVNRSFMTAASRGTSVVDRVAWSLLAAAATRCVVAAVVALATSSSISVKG